eukprot:SAG11_NODE_1342_length_5154_cov_2.272404_2_plen_50_part_00
MLYPVLVPVATSVGSRSVPVLETIAHLWVDSGNKRKSSEEEAHSKASPI